MSRISTTNQDKAFECFHRSFVVPCDVDINDIMSCYFVCVLLFVAVRLLFVEYKNKKKKKSHTMRL
jgi:hypothetical protein